MDCELERRTVETTKNRMHEEFMSNMARRKARQEFELERERKIKEMQMLTETDAKAAKEESQREKTEDLKEMMLQEIRRRPLKNEKEMLEHERMRRVELYQQQMNDRRGSTDVLLEVQEQLLKIFSKLKREKKIKKNEMQQQQEDNKVRMQEELVRKTLQKEVSIQEAHEKARRITESLSQIADGDDAKTKAIDMLVDVQKQLLDVFAISKVQDVKHRMNHLKVMNCRKNMLQEIRSRRVDRENSSGLMRKPNVSVTKPGRRLSLIGERLQLDVSHSPSQETLHK
ncbi:hypothetical protein OS493_003391 [Desmophyllum pertusum]|uniref:Uncharacterized protein n=1 Tax=Desmophyllum pertusum TaxID=174260 RepID=A0A9X0DAU2_9CNID|nr:hypothetical protein OS493_003391 [Desmophyllum pertusum]